MKLIQSKSFKTKFFSFLFLLFVYEYSCIKNTLLAIQSEEALLPQSDHIFFNRQSFLATELRYNSDIATGSSVSPGIYYFRDLFSFVSSAMGVRLRTDLDEFLTLSYFLESQFIFPLFPFAEIYGFTRASHLAYISEYSETTWLLQGGIKLYPTRFIKLFFQGGGYYQLTSLSHVDYFFLFSSPNLDTDIALRLGVAFSFLPSYWAQLTIGTVEVIDTFRINNPFMELEIDQISKPFDRAFENSLLSSQHISQNVSQNDFFNEAWDPYLFFRYQILLGFGQTDQFIIGLGIRIRDYVGGSSNHLRTDPIMP